MTAAVTATLMTVAWWHGDDMVAARVVGGGGGWLSPPLITFFVTSSNREGARDLEGARQTNSPSTKMKTPHLRPKHKALPKARLFPNSIVPAVIQQSILF